MTIRFTAKQRELYDSQSKLIIGDGIVGAGKTTAGIYKLCNDTQGKYSGYEVVLAFRSIKQYKSIGERLLRQWCREVGATIRNTDSGHYITTIRNGREHTNKYTRVLGRDVSSADDVKGMNLCGAFIDEAPQQPQDFLDQLGLRLRIPGHQTIMVCNPSGGKRHWFYRDYIQRCIDDPSFGTHLVFTMEDEQNPGLDPGFYAKELLRHGTSSHYARRNLFGEWVEASGLIWNIEGRVKRIPSAGPTAIEVAVDVASSSATHALLIGKWPNGYWVIDEWRHDGQDNPLGHAQQVAEIVNKFRPYGTVNKWVVDPSAADFKVQVKHAKRMGAIHPKTRLFSGDNRVEFGIQNVSFYFAQHKLNIAPRCKHLLTEIDSYVWDESPAARNQDKPVKRNDHGPDALRYWVMMNEDHRQTQRPVRIK